MSSAFLATGSIVVYLAVLVAGLASLASPDDPVGDPCSRAYF